MPVLREHAPKILQNPTNESPWGSSDFAHIVISVKETYPENFSSQMRTVAEI